jgi:hypothetical protein
MGTFFLISPIAGTGKAVTLIASNDRTLKDFNTIRFFIDLVFPCLRQNSRRDSTGEI